MDTQLEFENQRELPSKPSSLRDALDCFDEARAQRRGVHGDHKEAMDVVEAIEQLTVEDIHLPRDFELHKRLVIFQSMVGGAAPTGEELERKINAFKHYSKILREALGIPHYSDQFSNGISFSGDGIEAVISVRHSDSGKPNERNEVLVERINEKIRARVLKVGGEKMKEGKKEYSASEEVIETRPWN